MNKKIELEKKKLKLNRRIDNISSLQLLDMIDKFLDDNQIEEEIEGEEEEMSEDLRDETGKTKVWGTKTVQLKDAKKFLNNLNKTTGRQF